MSDFLLWAMIGISLSACAYGLPLAVSGLLFGMDPANLRLLPPMPPTREESRRLRELAERRARYFEDTQ